MLYFLFFKKKKEFRKMAGRRHPSFVALDECEKQVKITIRNHLDEIATFLKDSNIIDHTLYNDVTNPASREKADDKAIRLYMKLQEMIEGDEDYFFEFVGFLRKNHVFKETVAMLHGAYPGKSKSLIIKVPTPGMNTGGIKYLRQQWPIEYQFFQKCLHCVPLNVCWLCMNLQDLYASVLGDIPPFFMILTFTSCFVIDFLSA